MSSFSGLTGGAEVPPGQATRRDFLYIATGAVAVSGGALTLWPMIDQMAPSADVIAAGAPITVDISHLAAGQQMTVIWRSKPIFISHRTPQNLADLKSPGLRALLSDPNSTAHQQPQYAQNWSRSVKPEICVLIGICTHLGCIPKFQPDSAMIGRSGIGYFCPCHGSKYDIAGRVFKGVPAPYNLPVPPYHFASAMSLVIGANPPGSDFSVSSIQQM